MNDFNRVKFSAVVVSLMFFVISAAAQIDKKPYTEWSEKEAQKVLSNSPWSQTQTVTDTSGTFNTSGNIQQRGSGAGDVVNINFRVRFFSSKPVRQAFSRLIQLQQKDKLSESAATQLKGLSETEFANHIVVTIDCDAPTATKKLQQAKTALVTATAAEFKNDTYLLVKGSERLYLQDYQKPGKDGFGAMFIFPRMVNDKPYLTAESGEIVFRSELKGIVAINVRFKAKDMMFGDKLEY
jgi:hypothetical protein